MKLLIIFGLIVKASVHWKIDETIVHFRLDRPSISASED